MDEIKLQYRPKISLRKAWDKIFTYAISGEHNFHPRPQAPDDVIRLFLNMGINPNCIAEECRDFRRPVPFFQNMLGYTWTAHVYKGGTVGIIDNTTGEDICSMKKDGTLIASTYQAYLETAYKSRDQAVEHSSYADYHTAIVKGFAAIEAFLNEQVKIWNRQHPDELLSDSKRSKVSQDEKIDNWIPKIAGGKKLNKSDIRWQHYKKLQAIRDNYIVHPKSTGYGITYQELAEQINMFRSGIAGIIADMHLIFRKAMPAVVINAIFMPDVEVIDQIEKD